jgi:hypothetical protein
MMRWREKQRLWYGRLNPTSLVLINVGCFAAGYLLWIAGHRCLFQLGWLHSQGTFSREELFLSLMTGLFVGLFEIDDRKRRARRDAGTDRTMI